VLFTEVRSEVIGGIYHKYDVKTRKDRISRSAGSPSPVEARATRPQIPADAITVKEGGSGNSYW
jgi:hypothetical protein